MELHSHLSPLSRFTSRPCRCCGRSAEQVVVDEIRFFEGMLMRTLHQVTCRCVLTRTGQTLLKVGRNLLSS